MKRKFCQNCHRLRLVLTALLITMSFVAGYHWRPIIENGGGLDQLDYLVSGATLILLVLVTGFGMETVSAKVDEEVLRDEQEVERLTELLESRERQMKEMSETMEMLIQSNARMSQGR